jgi:hypothetical protein
VTGGLSRIAGHLGRRRDVGQEPAGRPAEPERAVGLSIELVALLVDGAMVPAGGPRTRVASRSPLDTTISELYGSRPESSLKEARRMNAIDLYRSLLRSAHDFVEGTMTDVTETQLHWDPPGKAFSIAANYAHVLTSEDLAVQQLLRGKDLVAATAWTEGELPPLGPGGDLKAWSHRVKPDLAAMRRYGQAVYAATDEHIGSLRPEDLDGPLDLSRFGLGQQTVLFILNAILANASLHTGEISCLKGLQGAKGYPV